MSDLVSLSFSPDKCFICMKKHTEKCSVDPCGHLFCYECIQERVEHQDCCPVCRQSINDITLVNDDCSSEMENLNEGLDDLELTEEELLFIHSGHSDTNKTSGFENKETTNLYKNHEYSSHIPNGDIAREDLTKRDEEIAIALTILQSEDDKELPSVLSEMLNPSEDDLILTEEELAIFDKEVPKEDALKLRSLGRKGSPDILKMNLHNYCHKQIETCRSRNEQIEKDRIFAMELSKKFENDMDIQNYKKEYNYILEDSDDQILCELGDEYEKASKDGAVAEKGPALSQDILNSLQECMIRLKNASNDVGNASIASENNARVVPVDSKNNVMALLFDIHSQFKTGRINFNEIKPLITQLVQSVISMVNNFSLRNIFTSIWNAEFWARLLGYVKEITALLPIVINLLPTDGRLGAFLKVIVNMINMLTGGTNAGEESTRRSSAIQPESGIVDKIIDTCKILLSLFSNYYQTRA